MPETDQQKRDMSREIKLLQTHRMEGNLDDFKLDGQEYFTPSENKNEYRGGGNFGITQPKVNERGDFVIVKEERGIDQNHEGSNTMHQEAAFAALAHKAAGTGKSRVAAPRALGKSSTGNDMMVVELMVGGDTEKMFHGLCDAVRDGRLAPPDYAEAVKYLGREIAHGLVQINGAGIVHGDIKPNNVFLDENMDVKIGDFGISVWNGEKALNRDSDFAAPELEFMSDAPTNTTQCDVHALGKTLEKYANGPLKLAEILGLAQRAMDYDPAKRPTAAQVAADAALAGDDAKAKDILVKTKQHQETVEVETRLAKANQTAPVAENDHYMRPKLDEKIDQPASLANYKTDQPSTSLASYKNVNAPAWSLID